MSFLIIEVTSEKALELQLTCESCHKMTFSRFDPFAYAFQGTIFDIYFQEVLLDSDLGGM